MVRTRGVDKQLQKLETKPSDVALPRLAVSAQLRSVVRYGEAGSKLARASSIERQILVAGFQLKRALKKSLHFPRAPTQSHSRLTLSILDILAVAIWTSIYSRRLTNMRSGSWQPLPWTDMQPRPFKQLSAWRRCSGTPLALPTEYYP